jgi:hypothetical protein
LIINVSLSAKAERVHADAEFDHVAIAATVDKGSTGSLELHEAKARVSWSNKTEDCPLIGIERLSYVSDPAPPYRKRLRFGVVSRSHPLLRLTPGEQATFSAVLKVPRQEVCTIEVAVTGRLVMGCRQGQWRTSIIALPIHDDPRTDDLTAVVGP